MPTETKVPSTTEPKPCVCDNCGIAVQYGVTSKGTLFCGMDCFVKYKPPTAKAPT
jgi:hypothetical protein